MLIAQKSIGGGDTSLGSSAVQFLLSSGDECEGEGTSYCLVTLISVPPQLTAASPLWQHAAEDAGDQRGQ